MLPFDSKTRVKSKKWDENAEMWETSFLQKADRNFSPAEIFSSNRGVLGENDLKNTSWKNSLRKAGDSSSAQKIKIRNTGDRAQKRKVGN